MATRVSLFEILNKVYGPKGLPFPGQPKQGDQPVIAGGFQIDNTDTPNRSHTGTPIRKYDQEDLGRYVFLPVTIDGYDVENPIVIINGEKSIVETDIVDVGTVFEKVFTRPYDISIICTLMGDNKEWPESKIKQMAAIWKKDDLLTIKCALTDIFLEQATDNFLITRISLLDAQGAENVEVIQIDGRSNIDFELELL